jgi:crotonobetainyl-CoA:carnitine CoA-transferase CaiB-like acyl-CoA transferase
MFIEVDHPQFGRIREVASPIRTEGEIRHPAPAPALGQHTEAILTEILGYGSQTIARLRAEGAIGK